MNTTSTGGSTTLLTGARRARRRGGIFKGLLLLTQAALLGSGLLISPLGVAPVLAAESADLDQCANDPAPSPSSDGCATDASEWVNGNLNASKSVFLEGDSIPYRMKFGDLATSGSHVVIIEWDTTKSGKHAIDYLTSWNASVLDADPCLGVSGCSGSPNTFPIPADPQVTGGGVTPIAGSFALWGGTITGVSTYSYSNGAGFTGDKSASIAITFTASVSNPVLAWGGHIASRADWGNNNSAVAITGSPYHMRLISLNGSGGNQDRSLKEDAVIFPGSITIIKQASPEGSTSFPFTAGPAPLANFNLVDDGTSANTKVFADIVDFQTYTVTESLPGGWQLDNRNCVIASPNGGSWDTSGSNGVSIDLEEGELVTCTFSNSEIPMPSLNVTKSAAESSVDEAGDVIHYTIQVFNTGNVTLTGVSVSDPLISDLDCDAGTAGDQTSGFTINVGGSITCTGTYTVTQADIDNNGGGDGDIDNTVTADSNETGPDTASEDVPIVRNAALNVVKTVVSVDGDNSPPFLVDEAGDLISYSITVYNTGNVTLTGVSVSDPLLADLDCDAGTAGDQTSGFTINVGGSLTCTGTYTVTQADLDDNGGGDADIDNTATADSNETGPDTDSAAVPLAQSPALSIDKVDETGGFDAVGDVISYTIAVTNTGNVTLTDVAVTDAQVSDLDCDAGTAGNQTTGFTLDPGEILTCTASHTITQADLDAGHFFNEACADDGEGGAAADCDDVDTPGDQNPALSIVKTVTDVDGDDAAPFLVDEAGDVISYSIVVTNIGNITLTGVSVSDPLISDLDCDAGTAGDQASGFTLAPGETLTCTGTYTVTQADLDDNGDGDGDIDNTATADSDQTEPEDDSEFVPLVQVPALAIDKVDETGGFDAVGDVIEYTIVATNTGNVTLTNVAVTDAQVTDLDCDAGTAGNQTSGFTLEPGETLTCTASHTITQADLDAGHFFNEACVNDGEGGAAEACDDVDTPGDQTPMLEVEKTVVSVDGDDSPPFFVDEAGDLISYSIKVTNIGNITLTGVSVSDPLISDLDCDAGTAGDQTSGFTLAPDEFIVCTGTYAVTQADLDDNGGGDGDIDNTATADSDQTEPDDDSADVPVVQSPSLMIDKVDETGGFDAVGDVISYTITVTNTGNVTLTDVEVTDSQVADLDCDAGTAGNQTSGFTIPVGGSLTCTASHTVTQDDLDAGHFFNLACADDGEGGADSDCDSVDTPGEQNPALSIDKVDETGGFDSVGDVIEYTIVATNTGNVTLEDVVVTDDQVSDLECLPATPVDLAPGESITCTASHTVTQEDLDEGSVFNEACVDDGEGGAAEACDDVDTPGEDNPALAIDKVDETGGFDEVGDVIEYTIVATNVGNVTLHDVVVTDEQVSDLECTPSMPVDLAPGESITCTASHTVVEADFETLLVFNQACVDDGEGGADEVCDEVNTPGQELEEETDLPTLPPTTSLPGSSSAPSSDAWWLVIALGAFMAMLLAVTPRQERRRR